MQYGSESRRGCRFFRPLGCRCARHESRIVMVSFQCDFPNRTRDKCVRIRLADKYALMQQVRDADSVSTGTIITCTRVDCTSG